MLQLEERHAVTGLSISTAPPPGLGMQASLPIKSRHTRGIFINFGHLQDGHAQYMTSTIYGITHVIIENTHTQM